MGHPALDLDALMWNVREFHRVVMPGEDRVRQILADLVLIDVEGGGEFDVADVVAAEIDVHQARDRRAGLRIPVILDALHQRRGAVAHPQDCDAYLSARSRIAPDTGAAGSPAVVPATVLTCCHRWLHLAPFVLQRPNPWSGRNQSRQFTVKGVQAFTVE